ncbi:MAG: hypothetical protein HY597_00820 [Candidatus Omnitrophica bacterium]|nr:hypothetical protein [Candidatus Omnitrophota bacterium]
MKRAVIRILDANLNRAQEGLRVCEEVARFVLKASALTAQFRRTRHRLADAAADLAVSRLQRTSSRESRHDVGRRAGSLNGLRPRGVSDILTANFQRAEEALRVLEEYGKLCEPRAAARFQAIRFVTYTLEKTTCARLAALRHPGPRRRRSA